MKTHSLVAMLRDARLHKKKVFICGNGGSYCDAMHMSEDLQEKGVRAMCFSDVGFLTATANDKGYRYIFSRPLRLWADSGDILITFSTSGASKNILHALSVAKKMGLRTFSFPTNKQTKKNTARTQDDHHRLLHDVYLSL